METFHLFTGDLEVRAPSHWDDDHAEAVYEPIEEAFAKVAEAYRNLLREIDPELTLEERS